MDKILKETNDNNFSNIKINLEQNLDITSLQTNFPILNNYIDENEYENDKSYTLKTTNIINKILKNTTPKSEKTKTPYIKKFYECEIINIYSNKKEQKEIFVKVNPLLDVTGYILNQFSLTNSILPNEKSNMTSNYINNFNNEAYIDSFFSFLASKLTETGKAPSFPIFYGTFSCISKNFKFDITEDYSQIKYNNTFDINKNKLFDIEEIEIDFDSEFDSEFDSDTENISCNTNTVSQTNLELINKNILDITEIDNEYSKTQDIDVQHQLENIRSLEDLKETYISDKINITEINEDNDFSNIIDNNNTFKYVNLKDFPTQLICIEKLEYTLDDLLEENEISEEEWLSILFQICFGLSIAQQKYDFVHNDLHSSNIMFANTKQEFLFFEIKKTIYKIPTFGKITKIIDFGRGTFSHNNIIYFSSAFDENGDAEGQYDYPEENTLKNCKLKPNKSFDLARLATTIINHFEPNSKIFKFIKPWMTDKFNNFLIYEDDDFDLYKKIAKDVKNAVPHKQLTKKIFNIFLNKTNINPSQHIFRY